MVRICSALGRVRGADVHSRQGGHRGREFQPRVRHPHDGRAGDGVGYGVRDQHAGRTHGHQQEELAVSDPLGPGDRGVWLCYYRVLQIGEASKVVPIDKLSVVITLVLAFVFLHERFTPKSLIGCLLIGAGTLLMVL